MGMAKQKAKGRTETGGKAPAAGGLSSLEEVLGAIKPAHVEVEHKLRQAIYYTVGAYTFISEPGGLTVTWFGYKLQIRVSGPNLEVPSFHEVTEPEPSLYEVIDYWVGILGDIQYMAEDIADEIKEVKAKA